MDLTSETIPVFLYFQWNKTQLSCYIKGYTPVSFLHSDTRPSTHLVEEGGGGL